MGLQRLPDDEVARVIVGDHPAAEAPGSATGGAGCLLFFMGSRVGEPTISVVDLSLGMIGASPPDRETFPATQFSPRTPIFDSPP